jgi:hypothetical protein
MATALDHLNLGGKIEWLAQLDTAYQPERNLRRTSIICTIGPKTNSVEAINKLRDAGLNVVRMNFSHGSYEYHRRFFCLSMPIHDRRRWFLRILPTVPDSTLTARTLHMASLGTFNYPTAANTCSL